MEMENYTSDSCDSDSSIDGRTINFGHMNLKTDCLEENILNLYKNEKDYTLIENLDLNHNSLTIGGLPISIVKFTNLHVLDISSAGLKTIPDSIVQCPLRTLVAKNNFLTNDSLPKNLQSKHSQLREINFSGNLFTHFPEHVLPLKGLKYLYLGGNRIANISKDVWKLENLQILSMGGNCLTEVPESVGYLHNLQALMLYDNVIEKISANIANLRNLKSLLLHRNRIKHLPRNIITLKNLTELSLRDNPLVVRFVQDISLSPSSLLELAARAVSSTKIVYGPKDLPKTLLDYLNTAHCCVNPKCNGVFFDNRIEHIKFVDFCGKYRIPLLQYLCSSRCIELDSSNADQQQASTSSGFMMRKVLLG